MAVAAQLLTMLGNFLFIIEISPSLLRICKEELPACSQEGAMLTMGALDTRGRERENDHGTFVRLYIDDQSSIIDGWHII